MLNTVRISSRTKPVNIIFIIQTPKINNKYPINSKGKKNCIQNYREGFGVCCFWSVRNLQKVKI